MLDMRRRSDFDTWRTRSMLTSDFEQVIFLLGGVCIITLAALVLSLL